MSTLTIVILLSVWTMFFYVFINQVYKTVSESRQRMKKQSRYEMYQLLLRLDLQKTGFWR